MLSWREDTHQNGTLRPPLLPTAVVLLEGQTAVGGEGGAAAAAAAAASRRGGCAGGRYTPPAQCRACMRNLEIIFVHVDSSPVPSVAMIAANR